MRISSVTVVGAGRVGTALGACLAGAGRDVRYAVRDRASAPAGVRAVPLGEAGAGADAVLLAVPFGAVAEVVPRLGLDERHLVVDATNPFGASVSSGHDSGAAYVASLAGDGVAVVKAFNVPVAHQREA